MASLKSHPNKSVNGIDYVDQRDSLYYNKYQYRARITVEGFCRIQYSKSFKEYEESLKRRLNNTSEGGYKNKLKQEFAGYDLVAIEKFIDWRNQNTGKNNKDATIRIEYDTAAIFSNDLNLLKTLDSINPKDSAIDYTEVDQSIPQGIRYYVKKPKHNYRVYLKSKRIEKTEKDSLRKFIDRYKGTGTIIEPCGALSRWLDPREPRTQYYWSEYYLSGHYYLDFDEESTDTLFSLMHGNLISRRFKLEKRPDPV